MTRTPHAARRLLAATAAVPLGALLYLIVRSARLIQHTRTLVNIGNQFTRSYTVGESGSAINVVVMGDSTALGTGSLTVTETIPYVVASYAASQGFVVHVTSLAQSGASVTDVLRDQLPQAETMKPDLVILSVGANDATHRTPAQQFRTSYAELLAKLDPLAPLSLLANTPALALVPAIQPIYSDMCDKLAVDQNNWLQAQKLGSHMRIVDMYSHGRLDYVKHPEFYAADKFHPSGKGYSMWARLFIEQL